MYPEMRYLIKHTNEIETIMILTVLQIVNDIIAVIGLSSLVR